MRVSHLTRECLNTHGTASAAHLAQQEILYLVYEFPRGVIQSGIIQGFKRDCDCFIELYDDKIEDDEHCGCRIDKYPYWIFMEKITERIFDNFLMDISWIWDEFIKDDFNTETAQWYLQRLPSIHLMFNTETAFENHIRFLVLNAETELPMCFGECKNNCTCFLHTWNCFPFLKNDSETYRQKTIQAFQVFCDCLVPKEIAILSWKYVFTHVIDL